MKETMLGRSNADKIDIERMQKFMQPGGFAAVFLENCAKSKTREYAYLLTEAEYESFFNCTKYSSYDSFRVVNNRRSSR